MCTCDPGLFVYVLLVTTNFYFIFCFFVGVVYMCTCDPFLTSIAHDN